MEEFTNLSFSFDDLNVYTEKKSDKLLIKLKGTCGAKDNKKFVFHLLELHKAIVLNNIKNIEIDILHLDFINSSAISAIIKWLMEAQSYYEDGSKIVSIIHNGMEFGWQENFLNVVKNIFKFINLKPANPVKT